MQFNGDSTDCWLGKVHNKSLPTCLIAKQQSSSPHTGNYFAWILNFGASDHSYGIMNFFSHLTSPPISSILELLLPMARTL